MNERTRAGNQVIAATALLTGLLVTPVFSDFSHAAEAELYNPTIVVTDVKGETQRLAHTYFEYSHMKRLSDLGGSYIEMARDKLTSWVHLSQARVVSFERTEAQVSVTATLASGATLRGVFPDGELVIRGRGELGHTEYKLADVKAFEVVKFSTDLDGRGPLISRAEGAARWLNARKTAHRWSITDGDRTVTTGSFAVRDAYDTHTVTMFIRDSRTVRRGERSPGITVRRGTSETKVDLLNCCKQIEITGAVVDGFPEIKLTKKDGATLTASWLLNTRYGGEPSGFDADDMLVWEVAYGYDGVPLTPNRRIVIRR
jgi:hypothetical protein